MAEFVKDVIQPGRFVVGKGKSRRVVEVTAKDIDHWTKQFKAMQKAGLEIPVPWEHADGEEGFPADSSDAKKLAERRRAKFNAGWAKQLVREGDTLKLRMDIPRKSDASRVAEIGTFISPQFGTWTDGKGRRWENAITHFALTPKPVNSDQSKTFAAVADVKPEPVGSTAGLLRFSLYDQIRFGEEADDDETEDDPPPGDPKADADDDSVPDAEDDDSNTLEAIRSTLAEMGIVLGEGASLSGDLDVMLAALQTHLATKKAGDNKNEPNGQQPQQPGQTPPGVSEENTTVSMAEDREDDDVDEESESPSAADALKNALSELGLSISDEAKIGDDTELLADLLSSLTRHIEMRERRRKENAEGMTDSPVAMSREEQAMQTQMSRQIERLQGETTKLHRKGYLDRIDAAEKSGRIAVPDAAKLRELAGQYRFSLDPGNSKSELDIRLEVVEALPAGTFWTDDEKITRFSIDEERRNKGFWDGQEVSEEDADEYAAQVTR